jgi:nitrogen fixation NifU-like protein
MISDFSTLYPEVVFAHTRNPRNFLALDHAITAEGNSPLCGDQLVVYLKLDRGVVTRLTFLGSCCAIATASASIMTACVEGKTVPETEALFERFRRLLAGDEDTPADDLGELEAFRCLRDHPQRVSCALLPWHTLLEAVSKATTTDI